MAGVGTSEAGGEGEGQEDHDADAEAGDFHDWAPFVRGSVGGFYLTAMRR